MKPHLDAMQIQLLAIREEKGAGALVAAARDILFAAAQVIAFTAGVAELAASVNALPDALSHGDTAMRSELCGNPIRFPNRFVN